MLLCNAVVLAASNYSPSIRQRAEKIQRKFSVVFALFHNCDTLYNQSKISQEEIAALSKLYNVHYSKKWLCTFIHRNSHHYVHEILPGAFSSFNGHTQNAHAGEACGWLAGWVEVGTRAYGRARGREHPCVLQQLEALVQQHHEWRRATKMYDETTFCTYSTV